MEVEHRLLIIALALFNVVIILYLTEAFNYFFSIVKNMRVRKSCLNNLEESLKSLSESEVEWNDVIAIFGSRYLGVKDIKVSLQMLLTDALSNIESPLRNKLSNIRNLLLRCEQNEPFIGIPNEIKVHLEGVQSRLQVGDRGLLHPLADKVQELLLVKSNEARNSKILAILSVIFGFFGLIVGLIQSYQ